MLPAEPRVPCSLSWAGGLPSLMGWAFLFAEGHVGFITGGAGEGCMGGSADGGHVEGSNFGISDSCQII